MAEVKIGERLVGDGHPPFIVVEAGINHNGDLETAFAMIRLAREAGADVVKFQTFKAKEFVADHTLTYTYTSQGREITEPQIDMFKRHEFSPAQWRAIRDHCAQEGITFLSTAQNPGDLELLLDLGMEAIKVGSDDFTNLPLLRHYRATGLPLILSCGMADMDEVRRSLSVVGAEAGHPTILMLCTSLYPTPPEEVNMRKLTTLNAAFPTVVKGFSDHTQGPTAASLAVGFGAQAFEKHFTLDHGLPGPDHWFSEGPDGIGLWIDAIHVAHQMLGQAELRPSAAELDMRITARRSIVAIADIAEGDRLGEGNIGLRRPGNGLPPAFLDEVLGRRARRPIAKGRLIARDDFA
jgi:sialic acid synthase SpsE